MPREIYKTQHAGLNAYMLFEELSEFPGPGGWVELHKTLRPKGEEPEYPPVYQVVYKPGGFMPSITPAKLQEFDNIAKKYNCTPKFTARNGGHRVLGPECIIVFEHGRR